jgi:hypothetical protein
VNVLSKTSTATQAARLALLVSPQIGTSKLRIALQQWLSICRRSKVLACVDRSNVIMSLHLNQLAVVCLVAQWHQPAIRTWAV